MYGTRVRTTGMIPQCQYDRIRYQIPEIDILIRYKKSEVPDALYVYIYIRSYKFKLHNEIRYIYISISYISLDIRISIAHSFKLNTMIRFERMLSSLNSDVVSNID